MIGQTLSHYKILDEISRGGMGIVYRALDVKLNREVAFKVLPPELVADPDRKRRFVQEAQAAAALEHPHIAVIHEIDEADGVSFIAMELIRGRKLSELFEQGRLPLGRALEIVIEVAQGLSLAHERGIVHRDLKPSNIMVTDAGHSKIIDFGLAKLVEPVGGEGSEEETAVRARTRSDVLMGTVGYMSPEQARGQPIDHRTDLFSLGIVLYELLTGEMPFKAPSSPEILNAIINTPPEPLASHVDVPLTPQLQHIVDRCLEKDREDRYQTAKDLVSELRRVRRDSDSQSRRSLIDFPRLTRPLRIAKKWRRPLGVAAFVLAAGIVGFNLRPRAPTIPVLSNPVQITSDIGVEDYPTWSPDSRMLAYAASFRGFFPGANSDIWVKQVGGGPALNRTANHEGTDDIPSFSPDGTQIAFASSRDGGGIFLMSPLTGAPRKVMGAEYWCQDCSSSHQWSKDGTELAFIGKRRGLTIFSLADGSTRELDLPGKWLSRHDVAWSSDGRFFAYVDAQTSLASVTKIWVLRSENGEAYELTDGRSNDWSPSWSTDARHLYYVSNRGGQMDIWQQGMTDAGLPGGEPARLTTGVGIRRAVFSPDGTKLAYSDGRRVGNLWRAPILDDRPATWSDAEQLTFDQASVAYADVSPDGKRLVVASDRAGNHDLWTLPVEGGEMHQLTHDPTPDWLADWSPDGDQIAFYGYRSGNRHVWVMPASGGPARQLTHGESGDFFPNWSADGTEIVYYTLTNEKLDLWVVPADGGEPRQVTDHPGHHARPKFSPDGRWLVFSTWIPPDLYLARIPADGGEPVRLTQGSGRHPVFSPDGRLVYYTGENETIGNIYVVSVEGGVERPVTDLSGKRGNLSPEVIATDGEYVYFTWVESLGDIWVMDVARADS